MGKCLVIKGADFSQNAIDSIWLELTPVQGFFITNPSNAEYGKIEIAPLFGSVLNSILAKVLIPAGRRVSVIVKNNNGTIMTSLNMGYITSQDNIAIVDDAFITNISTNHHPADSSFRQNDGSFLVENSSANDMYFYMNLCYDIINGPALPVENKQVFYKLVN